MARILLVDDDDDWLLLLGEYLESHGFECGFACNARQAKKHLNESIWNLIISDANMPGESGLDLLGHVTSTNPGIPFIVMTACPDELMKTESLRMGASAFVPKASFGPGFLKKINKLAHVILNNDGHSAERNSSHGDHHRRSHRAAGSRYP